MRDLLYVLPALACPVGMGVMMWLMMRPNRSMGAKTGAQPSSQQDVSALREEIAGLRAELNRRSGQVPAAERTR
ncbi:hypothetical protein [Streptomyces olivaceoviridis]|uniref:hypothetical protein n=1 Tax=Streptomyces olivaceoviridis TaxID=1921 RepID=UPI00370341FF